MALVDQLNQAKNNATQNYQDANNAALANTNYNKLSTPDIAGQYIGQINDALSKANSNTAYYQNNTQNTLNDYKDSAASALTPQDSATFKNDMTNSIKNLYDTQRNNVPLYYQTGIDQAKQQYAGLRDQASVANQQNLNKLKETMAQQGLFNSGDNITSQTGINNQYANDLSNYNRQEQNYYDTTNNQIAQQKANYDAQQAQALIDLGYKADNRDFSLANLQDTRNQNMFSNSMSANNAMYGMSQDQYNNTIKAIAQQYGMSQDQAQNILNYANYNSNQDQRQFQNTTNANNANYGMYNDSIKNDQAQQQINLSDRNAQWQNSQWAQQFVESLKQNQFDNSIKQQQLDLQKQAQALSAARAKATGGSKGGGSGSSSSSSSTLAQIDAFARDKSKDIGDRLKALDGLANDSKQSDETRRNAEEYRQMLISGMHYDNV